LRVALLGVAETVWENEVAVRYELCGLSIDQGIRYHPGIVVKKLLLILVGIGVALVLAAYWLNSSLRPPDEGQFTTASVERGSIVEAVNATGILQPRELIAVSSGLPGEVKEIDKRADFNQVVEKGQPLLRLDNRAAVIKKEQAEIAVGAAQAAVDAAQASVDAAKAARDRMQELFKISGAKRSDVDQSELALRVAEAQRKLADIKVKEANEGLRAAILGLEMTIVRAPGDGVIIDRRVFLGQMVAPTLPTPLFTIASDLRHMQLFAQIAEGDISRVIPGLEATFTVYAYSEGNDTFTGVVRQTRLKETSVQGAVFYSAVIDVENREISQSRGSWMLRPGMTATVDIQRRKHDNTWKMPNAALSFQLDEHYQSPEAKSKLEHWTRLPQKDDWKPVWILKDKKPWPIFVRVGGRDRNGDTGIKDGQFTEVLEWDPEVISPAGAAGPTENPQVIIAAPPVTKPSIFDKPNLKLS
jgi:HlyD family secretion protein